MAGEKSQKRGGSSMGGGALNKQRTDDEFYGNSATAGHIDDIDSDNLEDVYDNLYDTVGSNMSEDELIEMSNAIWNFSSEDYTDIRHDQYNNIESLYSKQAEQLETFIQMSPKYYNQGAIYRGIKSDDKTIDSIVNTLSNGGEIDMRGVSSWSSNKHTAENFADSFSKKSIVFSLPEGTKAGSSIKHLSSFTNENEVLVSNIARFRALKIQFDSSLNRYYIDLNESISR